MLSGIINDKIDDKTRGRQTSFASTTKGAARDASYEKEKIVVK